MRQFVLIAHDLPVDAAVSLDDLPGAGRLDLVCRFLNAAFLTSHGIREAVRAHVVVAGAAALGFEGRELRHLHPDERSIAALVRDALAARSEAVGHREVESAPGVSVSRRGLGDVLAAIEGPIVQLHEDGTPVVELDPAPAPAFVLSDHRDLTDDESAVVGEHAAARASLGPVRIHADHAVSVAHNYLDTGGYATY